jgi:hypothetical protein
VLGDNDEGKNIITAYSGCYFAAEVYDGTSPCFGIEYERVNPDLRSSFAVSIGYLPSVGSLSSSNAYFEFYEKFGNSPNFNQISRPGFGVTFDFGLYIYFPRSDKKNKWFFYLGSSFYWAGATDEAFDNTSPRTESFSHSKYWYSFLDMGFGYRYRFNERYSLKAGYKRKGVLFLSRGGPPPQNLFVGLSYRF